MFQTKSTQSVAANGTKCREIAKDSTKNYSSPQMFAVGAAAELIQGPMNYSSVRDGFNRWYAWVR
jgi:hypothetical protein